MRPRILVTRHVFPEAIAILEDIGDVQYNDTSAGLSADELKAAASDKQAIVCQLTDKIDADLMDAAGGLKVIANVAVDTHPSLNPAAPADAARYAAVQVHIA